MTERFVETRPPLLPDRHAEPDFFVCDLFDCVPKGDLASLEHPVFSLATKPDLAPRRYDRNGLFVEVKPGPDGLATVHDRDVLIYCVSQLIAAGNAGREVSPVVRFTAHDLLKATNRTTNGRGYAGLKAALDRLAGTRIATNVRTGGQEVYENFGIIDRFRIVRESRDGRMRDVEVVLSEWLYNAVTHREVLTLSRDYFRLRKPLERRLYDLARKHCGRQPRWRVSLAVLRTKCGATSTPAEFRRLVGRIVAEDRRHEHLPDYSVDWCPEADDVLTFRPRDGGPNGAGGRSTRGRAEISEAGYAAARAAAPGWDVYALEAEWRAWSEERGEPRDADAAFAGFCREAFARRGPPR